MPELPEVETQKRYLDASALHKVIARTEVRSRDILEDTSPQQLAANLKSRKFDGTRRHGKYLFVQVSGDGGAVRWIVFHFGMTGFLHYYKKAEDEPRFARLVISFDKGFRLAYSSQRKLGRIQLIDDVDRFIEEHELGPDALDPDFSRAKFVEALAGSRAKVKSALMNQKAVAGVGNDYSDEILYQAGILPTVKTADLKSADLERLYDEMRRVLEIAVERGADPSRFPRSFLIPHRHGDGKCPGGRCDLKSIKISGRTSYYCPERQGD